MTREPIMRVEGLRGGWDDQEVLRDVTMEIYRGEILVIVGRSGCGKSTLMSYLLGLSTPWAGRVLFEGREISGDPAALAGARRKWGVLFQSGALLGSLTLLENVLLPLDEYTDLSKPTRQLIAMKRLESVGLEGFSGSYPLEVSGGMQKRAALARAMALDPEVLFFDEPSAGLDPVTSAGLDDLVKEINTAAGTTMVIVTHELPSIFAISDRVIMLDAEARGIIAQGTALELRNNPGDPRVEAFFGRQSLKSAGGGPDVT